MAPRIAPALLGAALLLAAPAEADPLDDVLAGLETSGPVVVRFEEERHLSILDRPLRSAGTLSFTPPDRLIRQTLTPEPNLARIEGDELLVVDGGEERRIPLDADPSIRAFADLFRGLLAGDREILERHFEVGVETQTPGWAMRLLPREEAVAERIARIDVSGGEARVERIAIHETGGDRTVLHLGEPGP